MLVSPDEDGGAVLPPGDVVFGQYSWSLDVATTGGAVVVASHCLFWQGLLFLFFFFFCFSAMCIP
jgi:hypothetical protein